MPFGLIKIMTRETRVASCQTSNRPGAKLRIRNHPLTRIVLVLQSLGANSRLATRVSRLSGDFAPISAIGYLDPAREYPKSVFKRMVHE